MKTFRVVCTKNPDNTIVDFATADNAENATITHDNLLKLRQYYTPNSENLLPPLMLHDNDDGVSIEFDKPEQASEEQQKHLQETKPRILAEYNKFKHRGQDSTLEINEETLAIAYNFIDPYQMEVNSPEEATLRENLETSKRLINTKSMRHNIEKKRPSIAEKFYTSHGD